MSLFHKVSLTSWRATPSQTTLRSSQFTTLTSLKNGMRLSSSSSSQVASSSFGRLSLNRESLSQKVSPHFVDRSLSFQQLRNFSSVQPMETTKTSEVVALEEEDGKRKLPERGLSRSQASERSLSDLLAQEQEELIAQKFMDGAKPITESELKAMYEEILSLTKDTPTSILEGPTDLKDILERLKPVLFSKEEHNPHFKLLSKVERDSENSDVIQQALVMSRELGQRHLSLHIFNLLLYLHSLEGRADEASKVFNIIEEMGIIPNEKTYSFLLNSYANQKDLEKTVEVFNLMKKNNVTITSNSYAILAKAYAVNGKVSDAFGVYEVMKKKDIELPQPLFSTLIGACIKDNQLARAWTTFEHMRLNHCQADVVTFTLMLSACAKNAEAEKAMGLFEEMAELGIVPSRHAFNALLSACSERPDYYETSLEILDRMTSQFGLEPDVYTTNTLLYAAQMNKKLGDARNLFLKIVEITDGTEEAIVAYTNLFFAYSKAFKPSSKKNHFYDLKSLNTGNQSLTLSDLRTTLQGPVPISPRYVVNEARLVMAHMERVFEQSNLSHRLIWPRASYLAIHTNYSNLKEATKLFAAYYTKPKIRPHFSIYINMLRLFSVLKEPDHLKSLWKEIEEVIAPLRPKSMTSPLEKKLYKKELGLTNKMLVKFYRTIINGFARTKDIEMAFELLEDMARDSDLRSSMDIKNFPALYQAVLMTEDPQLKLKIYRLCPDPDEDPIVRAKHQLSKKWKPHTLSHNKVSSQKRYIEKELIEDGSI